MSYFNNPRLGGLRTPSLTASWGEGSVPVGFGGVQSITSKLAPKEVREFSLVQGILGLCDARYRAVEHEISADIARSLGRTTEGLFFPTSLRPVATGLDTKTNAAGKYTVATEVLDLIELLRNRMVLYRLGAKVLSGLTGNVQFPRLSSAMTAYWVAENSGSDVTASDVAFSALTLSPKTLMSTTSFSRQLLAQSSLDVERMVRTEIATTHALAIDLAGLDGTGSANQPTGALRTANIGSVVISAGGGGAPTHEKLLELETTLAAANADADRLAFLSTPQMRGKMKSIQKVATYGNDFLWGSVPGNPPGVGDVNGYPAHVSAQVPSNKTSGANNDCHCIILADWPTVVVAEWGILEVVVDVYSAKKKNMVEVSSFQMVDIGLRQPSAFCAIQDARL